MPIHWQITNNGKIFIKNKEEYVQFLPRFLKRISHTVDNKDNYVHTYVFRIENRNFAY